MKQVLSPLLKEVIDVQHYRPAVSIILPFSAKISLRTELEKELKYAIDKVGRQLRNQYPEDISGVVLEKIRLLTDDLKIPARKLGIAIFASPVFGKVYFLDSAPENRIVIDESFEIRDLLFSENRIRTHLLFSLSGENCKLFLSDGRDLMPVKLEAPESIEAYRSDPKERVANFTDPVAYKTNLIEKFLRSMDKELVRVAQSAKYPVFLMGSKTVLGLFQSLTNADSFIKGVVEGNFETTSIGDLLKAAQPQIENWQRKEQLALLAQIEEAENQRRLASGIESVWNAAYEKKGKLLIVEKSYMASGEHISRGKIVYKPTGSQNDFHTSTDIVDDVMELVLKNGGNVVFVEDGFLQMYGHIALVKYFT
jgi:hypothetical protein